MNKIICETIPYKDFRERLKLTKEFLNKGIIPQVLEVENCLLVDYSTKRRRKNGAN